MRQTIFVWQFIFPPAIVDNLYQLNSFINIFLFDHAFTDFCGQIVSICDSVSIVNNLQAGTQFLDVRADLGFEVFKADAEGLRMGFVHVNHPPALRFTQGTPPSKGGDVVVTVLQSPPKVGGVANDREPRW